MKQNKVGVHEFLMQKVQFKLPIYQRDATAWGESQCKKLVKDIVTAGKSGRTNHLLAIWYEVYESEDSDLKRLLVVDGQQRITNCSLLLAALCEFKQQNPNVKMGVSVKQLLSRYLFNFDEEEDPYKLRLKFSNNPDYQCILDSVKDDKIISNYKNLPESKLTDNFIFMKNLINEGNAEYIWKGIKNTYFIPVELTDEDDSYQVFNSINLQIGTRLSLEELLFLNIWVNLNRDDNKAEKLCRQQWDPMVKRFEDKTVGSKSLFENCVRTFLTIKLNRNNISFRLLHSLMVERFNNAEDICLEVYDFINFANNYADIMLAETDDEDLNNKFRVLNFFTKDWAMALYPIYEDYLNGWVSKQDFLEICDITESYLFRLKACLRVTNLNTFLSMFHEIRTNIDKSDYLASFIQILLHSKKTARFVKDDELFEDLCRAQFYTMFKDNLIKYIWCRLNLFLNPKEAVKMTDVISTEHINPQTPNKQTIELWGKDYELYYDIDLHKLGNLTCTGYNSELSNKPFLIKKDAYANSNFAVTRELAEYESFEHNEICERTEILARRCLKIWDTPQVRELKLESIKKAMDVPAK